MITTEQIKELRDKTGISIMQCKKALEEALGDGDKAFIILQKNSKGTALKKASRTLGAGVVQAYIHATGTVGAMVELSCETDFVAKNEDFKALAYDIAMHIAATAPEFLKKEDIPTDAKEKASEIFVKEVEGKPEDLKEKILEGKLSAYFAERILLEQPFIKDATIKISDMLERAVQKFGEKTEITQFARFSISK
ncbi:MAG: elongation factor Ts [Parcubacteria group bacterium]|nr:elongation factor Ts [Parcubacteria group bacterium]